MKCYLFCVCNPESNTYNVQWPPVNVKPTKAAKFYAMSDSFLTSMIAGGPLHKKKLEADLHILIRLQNNPVF